MDAPNSLLLDLRSLERGPREWSVRVPVEGGPWAGTELQLADPPLVELRATLTGDRGVHVRGRITTDVVLECRRCLEPLPRTLEVALDLLFDRDVDPGAAGLAVYPLEAESTRLDLGPVVREQLLLAVPDFPLCREDCAGLCPRCGTNLNERSCDCVLEEPDPRWDVLRRLRESETPAG